MNATNKPSKIDIQRLLQKSNNYQAYEPSAFSDKKAILKNIEAALAKGSVIIVLTK